MGVEHRALPPGGAHRRLQLGQQHPADALAAGRRGRRHRHLAAGVGPPGHADADHLALAASRQDDRPDDRTAPGPADLAAVLADAGRLQQVVPTSGSSRRPRVISTASPPRPITAGGPRAASARGRQTRPRRSSRRVTPSTVVTTAKRSRAIRAAAIRASLAVVGQGHVRHPRPGQRALQGRDEDGVAQGPQGVEIAADLEVEDRVVGQEGGRRPQGELQWAGLAGRGGPQGGQGGRRAGRRGR